jgi:hypothetical protein
MKVRGTLHEAFCMGILMPMAEFHYHGVKRAESDGQSI